MPLVRELNRYAPVLLCAWLALLLGACAGTGTAPQRSAEPLLGAPAHMVRPVPPAQEGLPPLPSGRSVSSTLALTRGGAEVYQFSPTGSERTGQDLTLNTDSGGYAWAIYEYDPRGRGPMALSLDLVQTSAGIWLALADYDAMRWDIRGPYSADVGSIDLSAPRWLAPNGKLYAALIVSSGNSIVHQLELTLTGVDTANSWPAGAKEQAWLHNWFSPLPPLSSADSCYQTAQFKAFAAEVLTRTNEQRALNSVPPLLAEPHLDALATAHCRHMAVADFFEHDTPEGLDPGARLDALDGPFWTAWAENIAVGYGTPEEVVTGWMNSSGHRANILDPNLQYMGMGVWQDSYSPFGGIYWCQDFGTFLTDPLAHDWVTPGEGP